MFTINIKNNTSTKNGLREGHKHRLQSTIRSDQKVWRLLRMVTFVDSDIFYNPDALIELLIEFCFGKLFLVKT